MIYLHDENFLFTCKKRYFACKMKMRQAVKYESGHLNKE